MAHHKKQGGADWQRGPGSGGVAEQQRGQESAVVGAVAGAAAAVEQAWETTSAGAQQAASAVARTAEDAWDSVRGFMGRYPLATFFMGVGVGALAVMALQRR